MSEHEIELRVNGQLYASVVPSRQSLVDFLRDDLKLKGTHVGCEHGVCGACTVLIDGAPARSCLVFAVMADECAITTVEGLSDGPELSVLQDAFWESHAMQCGYCTPGMLIAAHSLLLQNATPSDSQIRDALSGNICRCTGYVQIVDAVQLAATRLTSQSRAGEENPR
ncbi:MAG: (2Fe-2S)-binding protein [Gammaproteobacteria bacterium]|nr:(2Fe-2S)-binding protein [Gammaproteobacteria bacterium]